VKDDGIHKHGDELPSSNVKRDSTSFSPLEVDAPDDFVADRDDSPPQSREQPWRPA
jgi:hypothetical protein